MYESVLRELIIDNKSGVYGLGLPAEPYSKGKVRYLRISDIDDEGCVVDTDTKSVTADNIEEYILNENDLVVARTGNSTGRTYMYDVNDGIMAYAGFLIKYVFDDEKINPRYMKYFCLSDYYKAQIEGFMGSTRGNMSANDFKTIKVIYPDRNSQDRMVYLLELIDKKIKNNKKINDNLAQYLNDLYVHWFLQYDFPDKDEKPYKSSGGKLLWNDELKRSIPDNWKVAKLGDLFDSERGISYSTHNISSGKGNPMINLASFAPGGGAYKPTGLKHFDGTYASSKVLHPYDLVMCNTQQTAIDFDKDIIGRAILIPDIFDEDILSSHHVNVIRPYNMFLKEYLLFLFNSDFFHKYISGHTNGTNILGLVFSGVEDYKTEIPPDYVLERFSNTVLKVEAIKSSILRENSDLNAIRQFLMPMLMSGQAIIAD